MDNLDNNRNVSETDRSECSDAQASQPVFTRAKVMERENEIRLVDSAEDDGLDLFCYIHCANNSDDFVKQCRGLVYHGDTLVMKAFSYTDEYSHTDVNTLNELLTDFKEWSFYTAYEGALLRMFYFSGRWYLSTHRKLNAFRSKWASRESFGTLFKRALEHEAAINVPFATHLGVGENILDRFQATLDKGKQYMFLLRNCADNRIVCDAPQSTEHHILHVGTFVDGKLVMDENVRLTYPYRLHFGNLDELLDYVETRSVPKHVQGVICFGPDGRQVKVLNSDYMRMFRARGNEPSVKFRYLQVRMNREVTKMLYDLYPEAKQLFDDYENTIYEIANTIYQSYVRRFIKHNYVTVPKEEYAVIRECHSWHNLDRVNNRVNFDRVIQVLNKQSPTDLNHMIRRFKVEQAKKQVIIPRTVPGSRGNSAVSSPAIIGVVGPEVALTRLPPPKLN